MSCTNCFSGCVETTSDKCVKYTGNDIEFLGIHTGDSLESIELAITNYLSTVLTGVGILPTIPSGDLCTLVNDYLPVGTPTLVDILIALTKSACKLETEIDIERKRIDVIEADYTVGCINVAANSGTHAVLNAVIAAVCSTISDVNTLQNLFTTCITTSNINTYIQNYLNAIQTSNYMYTKMVPYVIYPFYPSNALMSGAFDITGAGIGIWQKVYLCNGYNGLTPDLRGRSIIGTTNIGGGAFSPAVDPSLGNPTYNLGDVNGQNAVILSPAHMASHTHLATSVVTDPGHHTTISFGVSSDKWGDGGDRLTAPPVIQIENQPSPMQAALDNYSSITTALDKTNISVVTTVSSNTGGGEGHTNVHPVLACHYIMYVP